MASIASDVNAAMIKMNRLIADTDVGGQDISVLPVNVLAGALIFIDNNLKTYTIDEIRQYLLITRTARSIKWGAVTSSGFYQNQMFSKNGDPFPLPEPDDPGEEP